MLDRISSESGARNLEEVRKQLHSIERILSALEPEDITIVKEVNRSKEK